MEVRMLRVARFATLLGALATPAQAGDYAKIEAQFMITGRDAVDPPPDQKKDRVALFLTGNGAKTIYEAMPGAPVAADACEQGLKLKTSGALVCADHGGSDYACSVAILLKSGETRPFGAC
jgi:hypothetical protein